MMKRELVALIESWIQALPDRMSGNEANAILAQQIAPLLQSDRPAVLEVLRDWLSIRIRQAERQPGDGVREGRVWLALEVASTNRLYVLRPNIEALIADVRAGKTFLPYYAEMIEKYLGGLTKPNGEG